MALTTADADRSAPKLSNESPSHVVVRRVADATGVSQTELPPLFDAVDPDALDALFADGPVAARSAGSIRFSYAGYDVAVSADGEVSVSATDERGVEAGLEL